MCRVAPSLLPRLPPARHVCDALPAAHSACAPHRRRALAAEGGRVLALGRAQAAVDYSSVRQLRDLSTVFDVSEYLGRQVG